MAYQYHVGAIREEPHLWDDSVLPFYDTLSLSERGPARGGLSRGSCFEHLPKNAFASDTMNQSNALMETSWHSPKTNMPQLSGNLKGILPSIRCVPLRLPYFVTVPKVFTSKAAVR